MSTSTNSAENQVDAGADEKTAAISVEPKANGNAKPKSKSKKNKPEPKGKATNNPYREGGSYWGIVETLRRLGVGKFHSAERLVAEYPKVVGAAAWKAFKAKDARNDETGKNASGRIIQNANVVIRADYGAPLRDIGYEVRKQRTEKGFEFGLFKGIAKATSRTQAKGTTQGKTKAAAKGKTARKGSQKAQKLSK